MMKSTLLFYRKLVSELKMMGFMINPYNPCVANKFANGSQMTLRWHVDNLKISHKNMVNIMVFIQKLKQIYGDNLAESTGKKHDYLRMILDFSISGGGKDLHDTVRVQNHQTVPRRDIGKAGNPSR
jgi:hypothetical protein